MDNSQKFDIEVHESSVITVVVKEYSPDAAIGKATQAILTRLKTTGSLDAHHNAVISYQPLRDYTVALESFKPTPLPPEPGGCHTEAVRSMYRATVSARLP